MIVSDGNGEDKSNLTLQSGWCIMSDDDNATTPVEFEPQTGYLILRGKCRQVICRTDGQLLFFLDKMTKEELPVTIEDLMWAMHAAKKG